MAKAVNKGEQDVEDDAVLLMKKLGLKPPSEEARLRRNQQIQTSRGRHRQMPRDSLWIRIRRRRSRPCVIWPFG